MAGGVTLVDTSVLIDYFRKKDKSRTMLWQLFKDGYGLRISVITEYEILIGATEEQRTFWSQLLRHIAVLPLRSAEIQSSEDPSGNEAETQAAFDPRSFYRSYRSGSEHGDRDTEREAF